MGVMAMALFKGDVLGFFQRTGKIPGYVTAVLILALIGPFGGLPRCVALSHATLKTFFPNFSLPLFSVIACTLIFLLTFKRTRLISLLGSVLTPFLLISMGIIIVKGLWGAPELTTTTDLSAAKLFASGLREGYNTLDLLPAFFFSSIVLSCLTQEKIVNEANEENQSKKLLKIMMKASLISGLFLGVIYVGLSYLAAHYSPLLATVPQDIFLTTIAMHVLGPYAGAFVCGAVLLSCLTTAIALAAVFSDFMYKEVAKEKISYHWILTGTMIISSIIATLEFSGIVKMLAPILQLCYPSLIVMAVLNLVYKVYDFQRGKKLVPATFIGTLLLQML
jgi:LIVCS family branched-chain amino acid:cation transporter